jgi:DNA polymerase-1
LTATFARVPNRSWFDPVLGARMHTGENAVSTVVDLLHSVPPGSVRVAADIETPGLNTFDINCLTFAWDVGEGVQAVLIAPDDKACIDTMWEMAETVCWHNSAFDVPILWQAGLIGRETIAKTTDTLILARLAEPDQYTVKKLEACAARHLGLDELAGGMGIAFRAAGYHTLADGYGSMHVDSPVYRFGAMADTAVTLALEPVLRDAARAWLTTHPFVDFGAGTPEQADEIIATQDKVNRVMLRRSAVGLAVDTDYLMRYAEQVDDERQRAEAVLASAGLQGGAGKAAALVRYLADQGQLPQPWPLTPKGALRATKDDLDSLDHPLATAQRFLAASDKVLGYLEKVDNQARVTGRCHPQCNILGASQTGRASYAVPEIHQFPARARPVICDDGQGLTSIDWSTIEPVTMAMMACDTSFLAPYEEGADVYEPIQRACGVVRDVAKTVLLAAMYGQGTTKMARKIGHTTESAAQLRRQMFAAMPQCARWMTKVQTVAEQYRRVITAGGRILSVPVNPKDGKLMTYPSVNHVVQGSAYDILAHTVCAMEDDGIGDHIQLTMHDEVVIDTEVAEHVERLMQAAPPFLVRYFGRPVTLRTDRHDMGHSWKKV